MRKKHRILWIIISVMVLVSMVMFSVLPYLNAAQFDYDISVRSAGISFSQPQPFYVGDQIRVYGTVENVGNKDTKGYVQFFQGVNAIGEAIPLSSKASGAPEDVWVDWVAEEGTYNIQFRILDSTPLDQNTSNNQTVSTTFTVTERPLPPPPPAPTPNPSSTPTPTTTSNSSPSQGSSGGASAATSSSTSGSNTSASGSTSTKKNTSYAALIPASSGSALPVLAQEEQRTVPPYGGDATTAANDSEPILGPSAASDSAIIPDTKFNKPTPIANLITTVKNLDMYVMLLMGSIIAVLILLLLAYLFWKKTKQSQEKESNQHVKSESKEKAMKDFLSENTEDKR
ncbi:MAG: hypothetical protein AAB870_04645 [Patescibacteria group bacterium]